MWSCWLQSLTLRSNKFDEVILIMTSRKGLLENRLDSEVLKYNALSYSKLFRYSFVFAGNSTIFGYD